MTVNGAVPAFSLDDPYGGIVEKPPDDSTIWRYMDFTKYVSLIANKSLFFARASVLEDEFEGSYSKPAAEYRRSTLVDEISYDEEEYTRQEFIERMEEFSRTTRDYIYISSWHENERESAAMWELYLSSGEGVAIRSTVGNLIESLIDLEEPNVLVGRVAYIDFKTERMPPYGEPRWPFFFKRKSFEHEREVRAVVSEALRHVHDFYEEFPELDEEVEESDRDGRSTPVRLEKLIDAVYVAPSAPGWLATLIRQVNESFGVSVEVKHTDLNAEPAF